jgi:acetyl esterase
LIAGISVIPFHRPAPEYKYPAAHNDIFDTGQWVGSNVEKLGSDKNRFAIGGESAGAYFAAATALRGLKESDSPEISFFGIGLCGT